MYSSRLKPLDFCCCCKNTYNSSVNSSTVLHTRAHQRQTKKESKGWGTAPTTVLQNNHKKKEIQNLPSSPERRRLFYLLGWLIDWFVHPDMIRSFSSSRALIYIILVHTIATTSICIYPLVERQKKGMHPRTNRRRRRRRRRKWISCYYNHHIHTAYLEEPVIMSLLLLLSALAQGRKTHKHTHRRCAINTPHPPPLPPLHSGDTAILNSYVMVPR